MAAQPDQSARLRLLVTGDLHAHLTGVDYLTDQPADGYARTASLIAQARAESASPVLYLDLGDLLIGSAMGDHCGAAGHPMVQALNLMGADACALGNHDVNFGLPFAKRAFAEAQFPLLCANLFGPEGPLFPQRVIVARAGLKIGLTAVVPPQTLQWDYKHFGAGYHAKGAAETVAEQAALLRQEGADLVIAMAHTGFGATRDHGPEAEQAALAIAELPAVDLVVAGHSHHVFPSAALPPDPQIDPARAAVAGKPLLMAGFFGSHLAVSDLELHQHEGRWQITAWHSEARQARDAAPHPKLHQLAATADATTRKALAKPVGETRQALTSHFSLLGPDASLQLLAEAKRSYLRQALAATPYAKLPLVAAIAPFRAGGRAGPQAYTNIPAGPLTEADITALCLFPNALCALHLTGADVADWLERSAAQFHQIAEGSQGAALVDPAFPCYNFDTLFGLTYEIDLRPPARYSPEGRLLNPDTSRIRNLSLGGQPLHPAQRLILATTDYRASGASRFRGASPQNVVHDGPPIRDLLRLFLAKAPFCATPEPVWRFAPMGGTTVRAQTSPEAAYQGPARRTEDGFLEIELRL